jgi:hypothetical protein
VKVFDVNGFALSGGGEYVLGKKDLHSQSCYLIYGFLGRGEEDRLVKPGEGYEEILCAVDGDLVMRTSKGLLTLQRGHAVHVREDEFFYLSNPSQERVTYVIAGGPLK